MIEPFVVLLALLPLISYLALLSLIRLSGHVLVTTGGRDIAALAVAISGLVMVGPIELFFPRTAATVFGANVWIALGIFYALCVTLLALMSRPKLVVYGRTPADVFPALLAAAQAIDPAATGDATALQVYLPASHLRLRADGQRFVDYAEIVAFEANAPPAFWSQLLGQLRVQVAAAPARVPRRGFAMLLSALALTAILLWQSFGNQALLVQGFKDWLWR